MIVIRDWREIMKDLKESERVSPKQYGEHLQKKKKRGSKMKLK